MGKHLVANAFVAAFLAMAAAALTVALVPQHGSWWNAAVQLSILGGFVPLIYAVNIRIVPVFARREWTSLNALRVQVSLGIVGAWLTFASQLGDRIQFERLGLTAVLLAGLLFFKNVVTLFRQPAATKPALPLPYPDQKKVDQIATRFTRVSGAYLLLGLIFGLLKSFWTPDWGRWDLVWAHTMLVGFLLSMISGVTYHVLTRWTDRKWKSVRAIQVHFWISATGLPVMLLALVGDFDRLFQIAGPLQALALALLLFNALPLVGALPPLTKFSWIAASLFLITGISLGGMFALDPVLGVRLRMAHAEINLFGWGGLLISGMALYLVPRFAGAPLFWPRLARMELSMLTLGAIIGATSLGLRGYGHGSESAIWIGQLMVAGSFLLMAGIVGMTFRSAKPVPAQMVQIQRVSKPIQLSGM